MIAFPPGWAWKLPVRVCLFACLPVCLTGSLPSGFVRYCAKMAHFLQIYVTGQGMRDFTGWPAVCKIDEVYGIYFAISNRFLYRYLQNERVYVTHSYMFAYKNYIPLCEKWKIQTKWKSVPNGIDRQNGRDKVKRQRDINWKRLSVTNGRDNQALFIHVEET